LSTRARGKNAPPSKFPHFTIGQHINIIGKSSARENVRRREGRKSCGTQKGALPQLFGEVVVHILVVPIIVPQGLILFVVALVHPI